VPSVVKKLLSYLSFTTLATHLYTNPTFAEAYITNYIQKLWCLFFNKPYFWKSI